jgi:hypothetical protein
MQSAITYPPEGLSLPQCSFCTLVEPPFVSPQGAVENIQIWRPTQLSEFWMSSISLLAMCTLGKFSDLNNPLSSSAQSEVIILHRVSGIFLQTRWKVRHVKYLSLDLKQYVLFKWQPQLLTVSITLKMLTKCRLNQAKRVLILISLFH